MIYPACKRILDVLISLLALILLSPVMLVVALLILIRMGRPVLFVHERAGLHGKPFKFYKFRTMTGNPDLESGVAGHEKRLTPLGKKLRALSLDELPQFWNVLKGDMSLVGPRPLWTDYLPLYSPEQARRHEVKPGITGWAQVNGRNAITWPERFKLDVWYVDQRGFILDLKIFWLTIIKVIKREGITPDGRESLDRFKGNNSMS
jgi:sugar transferase EpsL